MRLPLHSQSGRCANRPTSDTDPQPSPCQTSCACTFCPSLRDQFSCLLAVCICNDWLAGYSHSTFPPSLPASLVSSCRAAPPHHLYTTEATSTDRTTHTASDNSFSSHLSLYQSIPEYFRQHMEPPELPQVSHHPPANPVNAEPLNTAGMPSTYRTLRSASAGRKPEKANSLLDEFATEELQTLSKLLPAPAAAAVAHTQPEDVRSASPGSPHSASTVGSQPTGSEHLSPESVPRTHSRAVSKRSSSASNSSCLLQPYVCKAGTAYANRNPVPTHGVICMYMCRRMNQQCLQALHNITFILWHGNLPAGMANYEQYVFECQV